MERVKETLDIADIQQELTRQNYKEKFHKLLCWEEKEHIDILERRLEFIILGWIDVSCTQREDIHLTKKLLTKAINYVDRGRLEHMCVSICVCDLCETCLYYIEMNFVYKPIY